MQLEVADCDSGSLISAMRDGKGTAEVMGISLDKLRSGVPRATLTYVERLRKAVAPAVRKVIGKG